MKKPGGVRMRLLSIKPGLWGKPISVLGSTISEKGPYGEKVTCVVFSINEEEQAWKKGGSGKGAAVTMVILISWLM
jgi:hypothetical protein